MNEIAADVRTRMEGGVEQLEALLFGLDRVDKAIAANVALGESLEAVRRVEAHAGDAAHRAAKFPELQRLLGALTQARAQLDRRLLSLWRELRLDAPATFEQRLAAAEAHLPIIYRGALEGSGLAWAGAVIAAGLAAVTASSQVPWAATLPIAAGLGALLWDRSRARSIVVSQRQLVVGFRSVPLASIREIIVPRVGGAYHCRLAVEEAAPLEVPAITPLLDVLRGAGVEVRFE